jgi:hypothetical protein
MMSTAMVVCKIFTYEANSYVFSVVVAASAVVGGVQGYTKVERAKAARRHPTYP